MSLCQGETDSTVQYSTVQMTPPCPYLSLAGPHSGPQSQKWDFLYCGALDWAQEEGCSFLETCGPLGPEQRTKEARWLASLAVQL
jgi:hypothetical protein